MSMHLKRLAADFALVSRTLIANPYLRILSHQGDPPDRYLIQINVPGMTIGADRQPQLADVHRAEIYLPMDYPRRPPFCRMTTPVYHPNIDPQKICIGDHWSAGQSLEILFAMIAEMICFQSYNVKSPLNAEAAVWVQTHQQEVPLLKSDLRVGL